MMIKTVFLAEQDRFYDILKSHQGSNPVIVYCRKERAVNRLDRMYAVNSEDELIYATWRTVWEGKHQSQEDRVKIIILKTFNKCIKMSLTKYNFMLLFGGL